jgi:hypothetical protein
MLKQMGSSPSDPGCLWRRIARDGAVLCMIGTFIPLGNGNVTLWDSFSTMSRFASAGTISSMSTYGYSPFWLGIIVCFWHAAMFSGFAFFIACSPYAVSTRRIRWLPWSSLLALYLVYLSVPPMMLLKQLPEVTASSENLIAAALAGCGLYVTLFGFLFLLSWDRRRKPTFIFWLGALPLVLLLLRWVASLFTSLTRNYTWHFILLGVVEISGSLLLLLGWFMWWREVARSEAEVER